MKKLLAFVLSTFVLTAATSAVFAGECVDGQWAGTYPGPSPNPPDCPNTPVNPPLPEEPTGPVRLCIDGWCESVIYEWYKDFALATWTNPTGYPIMGWAGPCLEAQTSSCPDIFNQAFLDLRLNALRVHRGIRYSK